MDHAKGRQAPKAELNPRRGADPNEVVFHPAGTHDLDGDELHYEWDFDGDGAVDSTEAGEVRHRYARPGEYTATLTVTDQTGRSATARTTAVAGNDRPGVTITSPGDGIVAAPGDTVPFAVSVSDDRATDCGRVRVEYIVDGRVAARATGCDGTLTIPRGGGTLAARYTDRGTPQLTGSAHHLVHALEWEAESVTEAFGLRVTEHPAASGGARAGDLEPGDWLKLDRADLTGVTGMTFRVSATAPGATITVQYHEVGGQALFTRNVPATGDMDTYVDVTAALKPPPGTEPLYMVVGGPPGVLTVDKVTFRKG